MKKIGNLFQAADWKIEKHIPVIECADQFKTDALFPVKVTLGKEIAHPNTTAHPHPVDFGLFSAGRGEFPYQIGNFEFTAHGNRSRALTKALSTPTTKLACQ